MNDFLELVKATRTCRRFREEEGMPEGMLDWLVDCARVTSCAANAQSLRYITVEGREARSVVFSNLKFAAFLKDWGGPVEGERPAGYIIILGDKARRETLNDVDSGLAAQTIQLAAQTRDIGCCIVHTFHHENLVEALGVPENYKPLLVLALGLQKEVRCLENGEPDSPRYWRDENGVHHVPKLPLETIRILKK